MDYYLILVYSFIGVFGLIIGSFLNVVIYRLPKMMYSEWKHECEVFLKQKKETDKQESFNIAFPRSHCPQCHHQIPYRYNIPVLSYLFLRGKCAFCQTKISPRYPFIEVLTATLSLLAIAHFGLNIKGYATVLLLWGLIPLFFIDLDHKLLPDPIVLSFMWIGLLINTHNIFTPTIWSIYGAFAGYVSLWLIATGFYYLRGIQGMGHGDFKLTALFGAWLGVTPLPFIIFIASFTASIIGLTLIAINKTEFSKPIPFGPFLIFGGTIMFLYGQSIIERFFHLVIL